MAGWQDISTAPRDTPILTLNHDGELWLARLETADGQEDRWVFRTNKLREPRSYRVHEIDGKRLLEPTNGDECDYWASEWTIWARGYDFRPTHWAEAPTQGEPRT